VFFQKGVDFICPFNFVGLFMRLHLDLQGLPRVLNLGQRTFNLVLFSGDLAYLSHRLGVLDQI